MIVLVSGCFFFSRKISVQNLELGDDYSLTQLSTFWLNHFDNFMQSVNTSERKTRRKKRRREKKTSWNKMVLGMNFCPLSFLVAFKTLYFNVEFRCSISCVLNMVLRAMILHKSSRSKLIHSIYTHTQFVGSKGKKIAVHCGRHWHKYEIFYANMNFITQRNTLAQSSKATLKSRKKIMNALNILR